MKAIVFFALASLALADTQPDVKNAQLETRALSGSLESAMRASEPTWFGYAIATVQRNGNESCNCRLEDTNWSETKQVKLEGSREGFLLYRVVNNQVEKIRLTAPGCSLDAGGRRFVWLSGVSANASLDYLEKLAASDHAKDLADRGIFAIAQHDSPRADDLLQKFAQSGSSMHVREQAVFWMGASRGARGAQMLKDILARDSDDKIREKAVFALSINPQPDSMNFLIETAEHDASSHVRGQALFWLAQKAGKRAASTIENAIANDPDRAVKRQAVFALSQLPKDQSVPKLIEVAQKQQDPEVRKQAFFWLGQSNDPRALAFFKQILKQ